MIATNHKTLISSDEATKIAQNFIADELGNLIGVGNPCRITSGFQSAWCVPLFLSSPGYGIVGVTGTVLVDLEFGNIIGWTPFEEVRVNAKTLTASHSDELDSSFQQYRSRYTAHEN